MILEPTLETIWLSLVLAIAASIISITVTQTEVFRPLREWVDKRNKFFAYLFSCFYCFKHWTVFILVFIYQTQLISSNNIFINFVVTSFFIIGISTIFSGLVFKVMITNATRDKIETSMEEEERKKE